MDELLDYVQQIDPLWSVALVAAALGILLIAKLWRRSFGYVLGFLVLIALVGVLAAGGYYGNLYLEQQKVIEERRALDERADTLFTKTVEPDSVFACVDGSPVPAMLEACERSLFAEPQRVAAAVAVVTQRLAFLRDAIAFAAERDPGYAGRIAPLRKAIESDPYGFVAFVLSVEHGCTYEKCARFDLLREPERVRENMRVRRLEAYMAKHSTTWRGSSELPADSSPTVGGPPSSPLVTIIGEPVAPPPVTTDPGSTAPAALETPAPVTAPMVAPPSAAKAAADPPVAAVAPVFPRAAGADFSDPPHAAKRDARPAGAQAKVKSRPVDPVSRRSAEPVAGLPRVVPSDYIRREDEPEEEEEPAQSAARPGSPIPIAPPR